MKEALILQGWYQKPSSNWYPWLKSKLEEKGYLVHLPDLPTIHTDLPNWNKIKKAILNLVEINEDILIIGHSLGCLMTLRLAEDYKFKKMILISGWDFNDLSLEHRLFWKNPLNHKKIVKNVNEIVCVGSDNDHYFTFFTVDEMSKRLHGKSLMVRGAGHFTEEFGITEIPEILEFI